MNDIVAVRIDKELLKFIDDLGKEDYSDRSTTIRKLIKIGYSEEAKKKAAERYIKGNTTISDAAHTAGLSIWDMEKYLIDLGFRSDYSIEDLEEDMKLLERK